MFTELVFIKLFLERELYLKYRSYLPGDDLEKTILTVLLELDTWYRNNDQGNPTLNDLYLLCMPKIEKTELVSIFRTLKGLEVPKTGLEALTQYKRQHLQEDLSMASLDASQGSEEAYRRVKRIYEELEALEVASIDESPFLDTDLDYILAKTDRTEGLKWRLQALKTCVGDLIPGDFGFFVARPETGKTTMLASEMTYMASQLGEDKGPIIWFNNEEPGARVASRIYQSYLGWQEKEIRENPDKAKELFSAVKDKIKIVDRDLLHKREVESICQEYKPSLIILDQIDPIMGFKADREDLRLGAIYKWARSLTKKHEMATIAVCQADGSAEGVRWLHMDNVANSKTEKQATADWIIGIGKAHDAGLQAMRFLSVMKNKLGGLHHNIEVLIKPEIARYEDIRKSY